jgi:NAD(P)-dependent dehydrogenase (short-subunit alcohol dehydrogenase family)
MTTASTISRPVTELLSLRGKVALITGATGHLGAAMAAALAEAGATVVVSSRRLDAAEAAAARLPRVDDVKHRAVAIDHTDEASVAAGFQAAVRAAGRVDVLVNNGHEPLAADWSTVTAEQFNRHMANATGYFLLARHLRNHAVARGGGGSIVMLGSMYGAVGSYPEAYDGVGTASPVAYHALKGGIVQMTRHLAVYWARDGVRVNCLSPGPFPSEKAAPAMVERLTEKCPMRRMGRPEELKGALVFLASDAASYMTGQNLIIDGGWTAW